MKIPETVMIMALLVSMPQVSFAEAPNPPVTRQQVKVELEELESVGYRIPAGSDPHYPDDLLAAEARVAAKHAAATQVSQTKADSRPGASAPQPHPVP
jgi:hypothetical protein